MRIYIINDYALACIQSIYDLTALLEYTDVLMHFLPRESLICIMIYHCSDNDWILICCVGVVPATVSIAMHEMCDLKPSPWTVNKRMN